MLCFQARLQLKLNFDRQNSLSFTPHLVFGKENESQYSLEASALVYVLVGHLLQMMVVPDC